MSGNETEKIMQMLKEEQDNLLNEINNKIKKKKILSNPETGNEFLK